MRKSINYILGNISGAVYVVLAVSIIFLPLRWVLAWLVATIFHEFCHYSALSLLGYRISRLSFGIHGAIMHVEWMRWSHQLICTLAGPIGSLVLLLFRKIFPEIALCAFIQSTYNMLPIMPMDGGRAISCLLTCWFTYERTLQILNVLKFGTLITIAIICVYAGICLHLGILPVMVFVLLCLKNRKTPCKEVALRVQ